MPFKLEQLRVWQLAFDLADEIHRIIQLFSKSELFSLTHQIRRAADSVVFNIAEGSTGASNPENKKYLNTALPSALETVACLMFARRRNYIEETVYATLYQRYEWLS